MSLSKTRSSLAYGSPLEGVTEQKAARLRRLAARWLADHELRPPEVRIDLVGVLVGRQGRARHVLVDAGLRDVERVCRQHPATVAGVAAAFSGTLSRGR